MLWFEKDRLPKGRWPFLNTAHAGLRDIEESLIASVDLTEDTKNILITGCLEAYRQAVVRRVLDLVQSIVSAWNVGQPIGAVVCARALLETLATFHSLLKRTEKAAAVGDWIAVGKLCDAYAFSTMRGPSKKERTPEHPERIRRLVLDFIREIHPGAEQFWEQICDTAHPNGYQMMSLAGDLRERRFDAHPASAHEAYLFVAIYNCLYSCCWLVSAMLDFDILLEQIRNGGPLSPDHKLIKKRNLIDRVVADVLPKAGQK